MEPEFWHERWRSGQIGFHQTSADRTLVRCWPQLDLPAGSRVFVPLCGKSLDLVWLRDQGHRVIGVELSGVAIEAFCLENGIPARRRAVGKFELYEAPDIELYCGDFFDLSPERLGPVAAVYDRAAAISWAPHLRAGYVRHLASLLGVGTQMLLIAMEYPQSQMSGPPFSLEAAEVERLFSPCFDLKELCRTDILANEPRLRARGLSALTEVAYRLRRRAGDSAA